MTATVSLEAVFAAKAACDVGGHYSRPDVFQLLLNRRPMERLAERPDEAPAERAGSDGRPHDAPGPDGQTLVPELGVENLPDSPRAQEAN